MRWFIALGVLVSMAFTGVAAAAPVPQATPVVQTFTGSGAGELRPAHFPFVDRVGPYSSTGPLGLGQFHIDTGVAGTAVVFTRSDGTTLRGPAQDSATACGRIPPASYCLTADLVGGASDIASAHVVLAMLDDFGKAPHTSFLMHGTVSLRHRLGYVMVDPSGSLYRFGGVDAPDVVNTTGATDVILNRAGSGGWILNEIGQVFTFGAANKFNEFESVSLQPGERVVSFAVTPTEHGYWLFSSRGRAVQFGDAPFFDSIFGTRLNGAIVGSVATPTGKGYYMVASDGGVFAFGDARFRGSMGNVHLNQPVVGLVPTATNKGYWLVASDGGVFSFGDAAFHGSMGATPLNKPVVAMVQYAGSYMMIASDGGIFDFSNGPFFGSLGDGTLPEPVVSGAAAG